MIWARVTLIRDWQRKNSRADYPPARISASGALIDLVRPCCPKQKALHFSSAAPWKNRNGFRLRPELIADETANLDVLANLRDLLREDFLHGLLRQLHEGLI